MSLSRALRRVSGSSELPNMTPDELKIKATRLYEVVHAQPEARKTLFPEHVFIFQEGFDTDAEELVRTMRTIREFLRDSSHRFILRNVFNGETNMSERQKFVDILEYLLEIAKTMTDISPDFNVSFKEIQEILGKYPNDAQFVTMLDKIQQYVKESGEKNKAFHDALEATEDAVDDIIEPREEEPEDELRSDWDQLLSFIELKDIDTLTQLQAEIPNYQDISSEKVFVSTEDIQKLLDFVAKYILRSPEKVLDIAIKENISEAIDFFDEKSPRKFKDLLVEGLAKKQ